MEKIIDYIVSFLNFEKKFSEEEIETLRYGIEMILLKGVFFVCIVVIGTLFRKTVEIIFIWLFFRILRSNAGGYHSKTRMNCFVHSMLSFVIIIIVLSISYYFVSIKKIIFILGIISSIYIWIIAPVDQLNREVTNVDKIIFKKKSRFLVVVYNVLSLFFLFWKNYTLTNCIMIAIILTAKLLYQAKHCHKGFA